MMNFIEKHALGVFKFVVGLFMLGGVVLMYFAAIGIARYGPRLEKTEFHWNHTDTDSWIYAPVDVNVWAPDFIKKSLSEPVGGIKKTDDGAWMALWRNGSCGPGEYFNREQAAQCVEKAAQNDGFFGYRLVMPRKQQAADTSVDLPKGNFDLPKGKCSVSMYGMPLNCPDLAPGADQSAGEGK